VGFRMVRKSVTLNDLEGRKSCYLAFFFSELVYDAKQLHGFQNLLFTARRNDRIASAVLAIAVQSVCPSVCPSLSVCPSVCHAPVWCKNDGT